MKNKDNKIALYLFHELKLSEYAITGMYHGVSQGAKCVEITGRDQSYSNNVFELSQNGSEYSLKVKGQNAYLKNQWSNFNIDEEVYQAIKSNLREADLYMARFSRILSKVINFELNI